jgi:hypothetical protein
VLYAVGGFDTGSLTKLAPSISMSRERGGIAENSSTTRPNHAANHQRGSAETGIPLLDVDRSCAVEWIGGTAVCDIRGPGETPHAKRASQILPRPPAHLPSRLTGQRIRYLRHLTSLSILRRSSIRVLDHDAGKRPILRKNAAYTGSASHKPHIRRLLARESILQVGPW